MNLKEAIKNELVGTDPNLMHELLCAMESLAIVDKDNMSTRTSRQIKKLVFDFEKNPDAITSHLYLY